MTDAERTELRKLATRMLAILDGEAPSPSREAPPVNVAGLIKTDPTAPLPLFELPCEKCKKPTNWKWSAVRNQRFLGCTGYPKCSHAESVEHAFERAHETKQCTCVEGAADLYCVIGKRSGNHPVGGTKAKTKPAVVPPPDEEIPF